MTTTPKLHILVVEDDADMRRFVESTVSTLRDDLVVSFADDGLLAVEYLKENAMPNLIITDMLMPGMTGIELMSYVVNTLRARTKFIMITAGLTSDEAGTKQEAAIVQLYGCIVLRKPFRTSVLRTLVMHLLEEWA